MLNLKALCAVVAVIALSSCEAFAKCMEVPEYDPALKIAPDVVTAMSRAKLSDRDIYRVMRVVSRYETGGCWTEGTGNFDGQWLSLGVMQWNLGKGSLQSLLARFKSKYATAAEFDRDLNRAMPRFGRSLFDPSCRSIPIGDKCKSFLRANYVGKNNELSEDLKKEVDTLFESEVMRQLQVDYFARDLTKILDDLGRVFQAQEPAAWQVAWAMDLKTQQGRFPSDSAINSVRKKLDNDSSDIRAERLAAVVLWYEGLCRSGFEEGVSHDCKYNVEVWNKQINGRSLTRLREEAVHFTHIVSRTAIGKEGAYQADTFQRRATIAFGKGSVHGYKIGD